MPGDRVPASFIVSDWSLLFMGTGFLGGVVINRKGAKVYQYALDLAPHTFAEQGIKGAHLYFLMLVVRPWNDTDHSVFA